MNINTCKQCRKLFSPVCGENICSVCQQKEEEAFQSVKSYLQENTGASFEEVSEATTISIKMIKKFLRDGRLEVSNHPSIQIHCDHCGISISSGKLCPSCKNNLTSALQGAAHSIRSQSAESTKDSTPKARMHIMRPR